MSGEQDLAISKRAVPKLDFPFPTLDLPPDESPRFIGHRTVSLRRPTEESLNLSEFKLFKDLPPELQILVFSFAIPDPQTIQISIIDRKAEPSAVFQEGDEDQESLDVKQGRLYCNYKNVDMMSACWASRTQALKWYRPAFCAQLGHPIYFDFDRDQLQFEGDDPLWRFYDLSPGFGIAPVHMDLVRSIVLRIDAEWWDIKGLMEMTALFYTFRGLHQFVLMVIDSTWEEWDPVFDFLPTEESSGEFEELWPDLCEDVRRGTTFRDVSPREPLKMTEKWSPPTTFVGLEEEWRALERITIEEENERMDWQITSRSDYDLGVRAQLKIDEMLSRLGSDLHLE